MLNNALPIMAGIVAFHERLPAAPFGVVRAAGFVVVVLGAAMLARPERPALQALEDGSASTVASPGPPG